MAGLAVPFFCHGGKPHCFHEGKFQHAVRVEGGAHLDEICCWCEGESCRDIYPGKRYGHGPYAVNLIDNPTSRANKALGVFKKIEKKYRPRTRLIPDQVSILRFLVKGETLASIGKIMGVSQKGMYKRADLIRVKLKAKTLTHAVIIAITNHLI